MNWIDIVIIIIILFGGILGSKRGVFKELIMCLGTILVFVLAYNLKGIVGDFMVKYFPFFNFTNYLHGALAVNIFFYQMLAFILTALILFAIYDFIVSITGLFEKLLKATIVLGFFSKILGFIVGLVEGYIYAFLFCLFVLQPAINLEAAQEAKYASKILHNTPVLSSAAEDTINLINEISDLSDTQTANEANLKLIDIFLKRNVTSVESVEYIIENGKLNVKNADTVLEKYK